MITVTAAPCDGRLLFQDICKLKMKPKKKNYKLLDLYCCGGGCSMGYHKAGFEVVGLDKHPQSKYPFEFILGDAVKFLEGDLSEYDAISASPPCQAYTKAGQVERSRGKVYPDLVGETRRLLVNTGKPYVIENVPGSPLENPVLLCGSMFGLKTYRHRLFESNVPFSVPFHPEHVAKNAKMGRPVKEGEFIQVVGHFSGVKFAQDAMGIDWLGQKELAQAIPPSYTEFLGKQLIDYLDKVGRD